MFVPVVVLLIAVSVGSISLAANVIVAVAVIAILGTRKRNE